LSVVRTPPEGFVVGLAPSHKLQYFRFSGEHYESTGRWL
jgi:hypothetical protein